MKTITDYNQASLFKRWWSGRDYLQKRMIRMCLSMLVMVVCFPLYYLGLFGSVEGPLNPAGIGDFLANMGMTRTHFMVLFLSFLIIAVSWNWIYNAVSMGIGARLTCSRKMGEDGHLCAARVTRTKVAHKKTGRVTVTYVCARGHTGTDAHFHPLTKGTFSHTLWLTSLCFCVIVFFMS
ncbi:MAG: hypothetical protein LJE94_14880 [Deltaproteobacteria bacterium]|jgi:fumarate reductase subunit C|nr:hypothetical protein [Deltaproteobacteria bacterium]